MRAMEMENVSFAYGKDPVLKQVSFSLEEKEFAAIQGENGSGKSTLLKLLLGQFRPHAGNIWIDATPIEKIKDFRHIGYVPQVQNFNEISFPITTLEIVVLNLYRNFGFWKFPKKEQNEKAKKVLEELGLSRYINTPYNQLSGGFKQRTMIARAMVNDPRMLILDEPTAGVDRESKESFLHLIDGMREKQDLTVLIVTHEMELMQQHIHLDKTYLMEEGRLRLC